ncbi:MT-A70 family methyltransferase [Azospirillum sp. TSH64]|uniref:MT-A70 family methyltransferase n=1 Tax=Azospirillum sp. TSH64 TaxID=652740 RepID=UPI000D65D513|nr:MT-A70 family methyltransferase [Azospirillum sp. TSH64]
MTRHSLSLDATDYRAVAEAVFEDVPLGQAGAILADPPWRFNAYSGASEKIERHYDTMTIPAIKSLPVAELAAPDCVLFLWVTDPLLAVGLEVMRAWGFTYKTVGFNWAKLRKGGAELPATDEAFFSGMGYWTRANPELCLLGTRGSPSRNDTTEARRVRRLIVDERREHSRKPDCQYKRIEALVPGPYIELFSRTARPGWHAWGAMAGKFGEAA